MSLLSSLIGTFNRYRSGPIIMSRNSKYAKYRIGRWTYGHPRVYQWRPEEILEIGSFCSIASDVTILLGGEHRTDFVSTYPFGNFFAAGKPDGHEWSRGNVVIGNDVWIGHGALILSGTRIGDGAVVGAGSLVLSEIPPYAIAVGRPAKVVGYRFEAKTIGDLLAIRWWNWDDDTIRSNIGHLMANDVETFTASHIAKDSQKT
jgi:acetyltransferase-like isoleucine patch superfamily enzyme